MRTSSVDTAILEVLEQNHSHLSAAEVYERIRSRLPAVNPSTVYRSLERLGHEGKVSVSDMGTGSAVYETVADGMHHHLVCQVCGQVSTIGHEEVQAFFAALEGSHHFDISTNHLVLFGTCQVCQQKGHKEE